MDRIFYGVGFCVVNGTLVGTMFLMLRNLAQPAWNETPLDFLKKAYVHTVLAPLIFWKFVDRCDGAVDVDVTIGIAKKHA